MMLRALPFALAVAVSVLFAPSRACAAAPPFIYGAAFFYERMPRTQWAPALDAYRRMGINTIDLYVMWNWHEVADGDFDFTGRTNPRRDLRALLELIHRKHFAIVLRPGPVIRNEWRNGGYPAWLLERPEYDMPLRDVLEGRYPATATLQNAHSDAAAAQWLGNRTHLRYARRWLERVYQEFKPYRSDLAAIALDDDQGAYIDNDTWPAPDFHRYIAWLDALAHAAFADVPTFINTYQMKVTASAPVWAWGNWYQSDAFQLGEHDRAQIEFSTGLLQTQSPRRPIMISEFQAGWLQGADESQPRAADPQNTTLALHTFLQMGAHGMVNFPVQDTWDPSGWEAPWANAFYGWDAAFGDALQIQPRWKPTRTFGALVSAYGARLAQTHRAADAAIAYMTSAYDAARVTTDDVDAIAAATVSAQQQCRAARITCSLVDLRYGGTALRGYRRLIVPDAGIKLPLAAAAARNLQAFRRRNGTVTSTAAALRVRYPVAGGIPNAVLLVSADERFGFLDVVNYESQPLRIAAATVHSGRFIAAVRAMTVAPHDAVLLPLGLPRATRYTSSVERVSDDASTAPPDDGYPRDRLRSGGTLAEISRCSGARSFFFGRAGAPAANYVTTIGAFRDGWAPELPPSPRDYIAKYTHPIPTGTFNRCYAAAHVSASSATYAYVAPDAPGGPAHFRKALTVSDGAIVLSESASFASANERAISLSSFALPANARIVAQPSGYLIEEDGDTNALMIAYDGALDGRLAPRDGNALLTVTYAPGANLRLRIGYAQTASAADAQARFAAFAKRPWP